MKKKVFLLACCCPYFSYADAGVNLSSKVKLNKDFSGYKNCVLQFSSHDFHTYFLAEAKKISII